MYYVAFFIDLKRNLIVPKQWIQNIKLHKEKFYNNGVNSGQIFTCFYTNQQEAFEQDGLPCGKFHPNFSARVSQSLNGEGLFGVNLKAFKGIYLKTHISKVAKKSKYIY